MDILFGLILLIAILGMAVLVLLLMFWEIIALWKCIREELDI